MALAKAEWPLRISSDSPEDVRRIKVRVAELAEAAQYGWGHTVNFGPFQQDGLLGDSYLRIAGELDKRGWWPVNLKGKQVADIGCFTGALSLLLSSRGAERVHAVDEVSEHLDQCRYLAEVFEQPAIEPLKASIYDLTKHIPEQSLSLILCAGVLYHLSDMLLGLYVMRLLLEPGGTLVLESNAVNDEKRSYANFGRFYAGMWWQPTSLCIRDMCEFMGFEETQMSFHRTGRCLVRTIRGSTEIPYKRGLNWTFDSLRDAHDRSTDRKIMAPARAFSIWDRVRTTAGRLYRRMDPDQ